MEKRLGVKLRFSEKGEKRQNGPKQQMINYLTKEGCKNEEHYEILLASPKLAQLQSRIAASHLEQIKKAAYQLSRVTCEQIIYTDALKRSETGPACLQCYGILKCDNCNVENNVIIAAGTALSILDSIANENNLPMATFLKEVFGVLNSDTGKRTQ